MFSHSPLVNVLRDAQAFAADQSADGFRNWKSFLIPMPRPVSRGIWHVMSPGVQVMIIEAFPCDGEPPLVQLARPMGILMLKGHCCRLNTVVGTGPAEISTVTMMPGRRVYIQTPGTRCSVNPVGDPCIALVVRLPPFSSANMIEPRRIDELPTEHATILKNEAKRLLLVG